MFSKCSPSGLTQARFYSILLYARIATTGKASPARSVLGTETDEVWHNLAPRQLAATQRSLFAATQRKDLSTSSMTDVLQELEDVAEGLVHFPKGPKGGNLENPIQYPERRRSEFRGGELDEDTLGLHRFTDCATQGLAKEQPWHRMAAMLMLAGKSNKDIAELADCHPQALSMLRGQKWFQELLARLASKITAPAMGLLQGEATASVEKLVELRDNVNAPMRVQLAAAQTIIDHACGKPTQKVLSISAHTSYSSASEEMADIQRELETLRQSEALSKESAAQTVLPNRASGHGQNEGDTSSPSPSDQPSENG